MTRLLAAAACVALLGLSACATTSDEAAPAAAAPAPAPVAAAPAPAPVAAAPAPAPAPNPAIAMGQGVFQARCSGCHGGGAAPSRDVLRGKGHATIVTALTTGKMARQGAGLSEEEKNAVATFLTQGPA